MAKRLEVLAFDPVAEATKQWGDHGWDGGSRLAAALSIIRSETIVREVSTEVLRPMDLSFSHHEILMLLCFSRTGELPLGKIGSRLMVHPTSVSNAVAHLESLGLVKRVEHPTDRRTRLATITRKGRNAARRSALQLIDSGFGLGEITEEEAEAIVRILRKIRVSAGDFEIDD